MPRQSYVRKRVDAMSTIWKLGRLFFIAGVFLSSGCATTKLMSVWRDPEYTGPPRNIMVIGVMADVALKGQFEVEFVKDLNARGVDAVAGSSLFPVGVKLEKDVISAKMAEVGADTLILTRVIDSRAISTIAASAAGPPGMGQWYGFYSNPVGGMSSSVMAATQTNVYDLKSERLIWTAVSDTWIEGSEDNLFLIRTFVPVIMKRMAADKVIP